MNTRFDVFLRGPKAEYDEQHLEAVAVAVLEEIARLDGALSRFDPRSEIARVNRKAGKTTVRVDRELFALLETCEQGRLATNGFFDVTRGGDWELDAATCSVRLATADAQVDLGGIGKGYALDRGREILRRFNIESALLQGGTSSVLAVGDEPWPIDLRHPLKPDVIVGRNELASRGLSCSAARYADQQISDVVNPLTGAPLIGDGACVVLAASATEAEIFSTALLAMGEPQAMDYLRANPDLNLEVHWLNE
ncbi:MAG: FAD:protein FMN transferase [Blastocatellia bacterium]